MTFRFGEEFVLAVDARKLLHHGADVRLSPKGFELLKELVEAYPRALSKVELHDRLWRGVVATPGDLALLVAELRTALKDGARSRRYIRTLHGFGYRFDAEVIRDLTSASPSEDGRTRETETFTPLGKPRHEIK